MSFKISKEEQGFTLVEVTVYLGLLSIILTGSISTAFYLFSAANTIDKKIAVNEERNFVFNTLEATLNNETYYQLSLDAGVLFLTIGAAPKIPINLYTQATDLHVSNLNPSGLEIGVTISNQRVLIKKYLR